MKNNTKYNYCCPSFKESVEEGKFLHVGDKRLLQDDMIVWHFDHKYEGECYADNENIDETEWFMPEWLHLYYCPFCGAYIKGKGYGKPPKNNKKRKKE